MALSLPCNNLVFHPLAQLRPGSEIGTQHPRQELEKVREMLTPLLSLSEAEEEGGLHTTPLWPTKYSSMPLPAPMAYQVPLNATPVPMAYQVPLNTTPAPMTYQVPLHAHLLPWPTRCPSMPYLLRLNEVF